MKLYHISLALLCWMPAIFAMQPESKRLQKKIDAYFKDSEFSVLDNQWFDDMEAGIFKMPLSESKDFYATAQYQKLYNNLVKKQLAPHIRDLGRAFLNSAAKYKNENSPAKQKVMEIALKHFHEANTFNDRNTNIFCSILIPRLEAVLPNSEIKSKSVEMVQAIKPQPKKVSFQEPAAPAKLPDNAIAFNALCEQNADRMSMSTSLKQLNKAANLYLKILNGEKDKKLNPDYQKILDKFNALGVKNAPVVHFDRGFKSPDLKEKIEHLIKAQECCHEFLQESKSLSFLQTKDRQAIEQAIVLGLSQSNIAIKQEAYYLKTLWSLNLAAESAHEQIKIQRYQDAAYAASLTVPGKEKRTFFGKTLEDIERECGKLLSQHDPHAGFEYLLRAADREDVESQFLVAEYFCEESKKKNQYDALDEAAGYYIRAAQHGYEPAKKILRDLYLATDIASFISFSKRQLIKLILKIPDTDLPHVPFMDAFKVWDQGDKRKAISQLRLSEPSLINELYIVDMLMTLVREENNRDPINLAHPIVQKIINNNTVEPLALSAAVYFLEEMNKIVPQTMYTKLGLYLTDPRKAQLMFAHNFKDLLEILDDLERASLRSDNLADRMQLFMSDLANKVCKTGVEASLSKDAQKNFILIENLATVCFWIAERIQQFKNGITDAQVTKPYQAPFIILENALIKLLELQAKDFSIINQITPTRIRRLKGKILGLIMPYESVAKKEGVIALFYRLHYLLNSLDHTRWSQKEHEACMLAATNMKSYDVKMDRIGKASIERDELYLTGLASITKPLEVEMSRIARVGLDLLQKDNYGQALNCLYDIQQLANRYRFPQGYTENELVTQLIQQFQKYLENEGLIHADFHTKGYLLLMNHYRFLIKAAESTPKKVKYGNLALKMFGNALSINPWITKLEYINQMLQAQILHEDNQAIKDQIINLITMKETEGIPENLKTRYCKTINEFLLVTANTGLPADKEAITEIRKALKVD